MRVRRELGVSSQEYPPHVQAGGVVCGSQQDIWRPVPQGHHLIGVGMAGDWLGPGQTWGERHNNTVSENIIIEWPSLQGSKNKAEHWGGAARITVICPP